MEEQEEKAKEQEGETEEKHNGPPNLQVAFYAACAVGLGDLTGSIKLGKEADLIAVRTDTPRMTSLLGGPEGNLHHDLVHAVQGGDVDMTMAAGRIVVDGGELLTADLHELIDRANTAMPELFRRRSEWLAAHRVVNELKRP